MQDASEQSARDEWAEGLNQNQPISELIEPSWLEPIAFSPGELEYLEEQGREYAQELFERGVIPDIPSIDIQEQFLQQEYRRDLDVDFGR